MTLLMDACYLSLVTSNSYAIGAAVMAHSLKTAQPTSPMATSSSPSFKPLPPVLCMITDAIDTASKILLLSVFDGLIIVPCMSVATDMAWNRTSSISPSSFPMATMLERLHLMHRPDLQHALTKLLAWTLDGSQPYDLLLPPASALLADEPAQTVHLVCPNAVLQSRRVRVAPSFRNILFLDADMLVLQDLQSLFAPPYCGDVFAAAPDIGWPDIFNSGLLLFQPSAATFEALLQLLGRASSFDGTSTPFLNPPPSHRYALYWGI